MTDEIPPTAHPLGAELIRHLFSHRTLTLSDPLDSWNSTQLVHGLLALAAEDSHADIRLLINSPGGSVPGMLAIRDTINTITNDVVTINLGMAYSAGQFLLSAGTPGKRYAMPHSKVLLHQGSAGFGGVAMDVAIQADDLRHTRDTVISAIAVDTGQSVEQVERDSRRDRWFDAEQALDYGFIDAIIEPGFDVLPPTKRLAGMGAL